MLTFAGCGKDDEPGPGAHGRISFDGVEFEITQGYFITHPSEDKNQEIGLLLLDDGFQVTKENGVISDVEGSGHAMLVAFYSHQEGELSAGGYVFNNGSGQLPGHCIYASPLISEKEDEVYECTSGSVEVSQSGERYELELALLYSKFDTYGASSSSNTAVLTGTVSGQFGTYSADISWEE